MISRKSWEDALPSQNPFLCYEFTQSLEESGSIGTGTGWELQTFGAEDAFLYTFKKDHSYGEYIFDWSWAEAYQRYGIPYYPKLTSMMPFTPVTTPHFIMKDFDEGKASKLLMKYEEFYLKNSFSSSHFLFLPLHEISFLEKNNYLIRHSLQYHFFNEGYKDFEDCLKYMKGKKAKNISKERRFPELKISQYTGQDLTPVHAKRMYQFYLSTISIKNSFDYLNEAFFILLFERMKENLLYVEATHNNLPIAGSLFFYDQEKLYGRYWGSTQYVDNLHFELCYYQGIDFCLKKDLKIFEAGAQGEHKIARGFKPVHMYSAHKLKHPEFHLAVKDYIEKEKVHVAHSIQELGHGLPWK